MIKMPPSEKTTRRSFLNKLTGGVLGAGVLVTSWPSIRSLFPNVLYEPPKVFKIGTPDVYQEGVTFLEKHRLFLFRKGSSFHAISAICTHLGCTVPWNARTAHFDCPCHASSFDITGAVLAPPAPRPLDLFLVRIENGMVKVDTGRRQRRQEFASSQVARV